MMKLIRCKGCGSPIALRSNGVEDAFTPQANKLRCKYSDKLKLCTSESSEKQLCAECGEKERQTK
ncbi:MAG: hypothetical protein E3J87_07135 [Candidatus Cloacimonadota bacterium]|nr:MAG: hypothetical protein E3J87_07135 [Candidatus Cloacimonadota bacterium]